MTANTWLWIKEVRQTNEQCKIMIMLLKKYIIGSVLALKYCYSMAEYVDYLVIPFLPKVQNPGW
jgi:hypothetical protein